MALWTLRRFSASPLCDCCVAGDGKQGFKITDSKRTVVSPSFAQAKDSAEPVDEARRCAGVRAASSRRSGVALQMVDAMTAE